MLAMAISVFGMRAQNKPKPELITRREAKQLAYEVFKAWGATKLPKFGLELSPTSIYRGFYTVEATWENPKPGSGIVGHLIVDERTGDVWDPFSCKLFSYPGLERLQKRIRIRIGLTHRDYLILKRRPPC